MPAKSKTRKKPGGGQEEHRVEGGQNRRENQPSERRGAGVCTAEMHRNGRYVRYILKHIRIQAKYTFAKRVYSIGNLQKTKFYMGTPKGESTKTAIS